MLMPRIWVKTEASGLTQLGFLIETQVIATHVADLRLASCWWPYGRAVIGNKLQVISLTVALLFESMPELLLSVY